MVEMTPEASAHERTGADINAVKDALRKEVLARRNAIPAELRAQKSARIAQDVIARIEETFSSPTFNKRIAGKRPLIAAFWSFGSEVDTRPLIKEIYARGWRLALPCMFKKCSTLPAFTRDELIMNKNCEDGRVKMTSYMEFLEVSPDALPQAIEAFATKPMKVHTASEEALAPFSFVDVASIDAWIIPLVAFDDEDHRLGYGGGNYDRILPQADPFSIKVGIAFCEQKVTDIPTLGHDVPVRVISA